MNAPFVTGLDLSAALYAEVAPILQRHFPELKYAAARLARGSDVLGFDDARSTDHYWGPLLELFVADEDLQQYAERIRVVLSNQLPFEVLGYPTHFRPFDTLEPHVRWPGGNARLGRMERRTYRPIAHGVSVMTVRRFFWSWLRVNPLAELEPVAWLIMSEQSLRMVTSGRVFRDDLGELTRARTALGYYPREVWLYLLAAQWARIGQEEAFVGRTAEAGDELGSRLVAARLVRDLMRLAFLMERTYAPYIKWLGSAFKHLRCAPGLAPHLEGALAASDPLAREAHLVQAYEYVARMHNALEVTAPVSANVAPFHGRP
jgi:hypothetical protein